MTNISAQQKAQARPYAHQVVEVPISELRPDAANPRRISDAQLEALTKSLREYGFVQPVLARREDKTIIGGHQRLTAARRLGYKTVPVIWLDLTIEQARLLNLSLNRISGEWDQELLARLLADLTPVEELDLTLSGFTEEELSKLLKSLDVRDKKERVEDFDLDAALEAARAAPRAQRGEIWALGDHRLLCGDACDAGDVSRLFEGRKAAMAFTDPPYNVGLGDHGGQQRGQRRRRIQNDALVMGGRSVNGWRFWSLEAEAPAPTEAKPAERKARGSRKKSTKLIFKTPCQDVAKGKSSWFCSACMKSFTIDGEDEPQQCPEGHRIDDPELNAPAGVSVADEAGVNA